jgi:hypothetical protein
MLSELLQERQVALIAVEAHLEQRGLHPVRLQPQELQSFSERATDGWVIRWGFSDGKVRRLVILPDDGFPFKSPRVGVMDPPEPISAWPHLGKDRLLCILNSESTINADDPAGVVEYILKDAIDLIENSIQKRNHKDFLSEFVSYWNMEASWISPEMRSIVELSPPSRIIKVWHGTQSILFSDNEEQGAR